MARRSRRERPDHEHGGGRERGELLPGEVTQAALHAIAGDGVPHGPAHDEADTGRLTPIGWCVEVHDQGGRAGPAAGTHRAAEGLTLGESMSRGQHERRPAGRAWPSDGEALAALAAARGEDRPAGAGAHAQAEAVRLVTATVVRLVRTLAHEFLFRWCTGTSTPVGSAVRLSAGTAHPRRSGVCSVDMRHRSTPGDRPTVRAALRQGQTTATSPRPGLWMTPCRERPGLVTFGLPRFPATFGPPDHDPE